MGERRTPLLQVHRDLGARLVSFSGWEMPLQYQGVMSEHRAVRGAVGAFDVSHLGKLRVAGERAGEALQRATTADVVSLPPGRATYALVCDDDGGCIDDIFVYRLDDQTWLVVPNAANVGSVADAIDEAGARPADEWDRWAILAVQGPRSLELVERAWPAARAASLALHELVAVDLDGERGIMARTGYTGERGVELYVPAESAARAFERILELGATPAGLGARDTLRLEMGYALYGHELRRDVNPLEAGLGWAVAWDTAFRGRQALERVRAEGPRRRLFGVRCTGKGVPRDGYDVVDDADPATTVGEVTSGNFSPTLGTGIALALGPRATLPEVGAALGIEGRGRRITAVRVKPPFIDRRKG